MLALIVQSAAAFHATTRSAAAFHATTRPGVCGRAGAAVMQQKDEVGSMRTRPLGASGIMVSELGLGTQRWGGTDFNSPDEKTCHAMLDLAIEAGVNLVDTAESYPIPSGGTGKNAEGATEAIVGSWMAKDKARREKLVIASKITGGGNVTPRNLEKDLEGTLKRLGTDYLDVYLLHWPARYTPQANWGQSLEYGYMQGEVSQSGTTSFAEIAEAMGSLVQQGKIRGWGMCNDNAYGLMGSLGAARALGVEGPCVMQNDYSLINRRVEENGLSEASAPWNEDVGFMGYNALAGIAIVSIATESIAVVSSRRDGVQRAGRRGAQPNPDPNLITRTRTL